MTCEQSLTSVDDKNTSLTETSTTAFNPIKVGIKLRFFELFDDNIGAGMKPFPTGTGYVDNFN